MASSVERKLKNLETEADHALHAPCGERRRLLAKLENQFDHIRDDIDSIQSGELARKLAGKSARALDKLDRAHRQMETRCAGFGNASESSMKFRELPSGSCFVFERPGQQDQVRKKMGEGSFKSAYGRGWFEATHLQNVTVRRKRCP